LECATMGEEFKVHVVDYGAGRNLMMRYRDPVSGRQVARTTKTRNATKAEREAAKWEAELREGRYKTQSRMTWAEFREKYETEVLPGLSDGTGDCKASVFNYIEKTINPQRLAELTTARLSAFASMLRAGGMKETTLAVHLAHLKPVLKWAVRQGYLRAMPDIDMPKRAKGISQAMRGRPITGEELDRMIAKVPDKRKREPEKWQRLLRGLNLSGLRLGEALALSWDDDAPICVCTDGKYPALRIRAEAEKAHRDRLLPIAPEFAEFLLAIPKANRRDLVFGIYGQSGKPLSTKRASRYISAIGKAANVVTNKAENRYASAHDLRRSFGTRWARRVPPAILRDLMRHSSITTTMTYYVSQSAEDVGDVLRSAVGNTAGNTRRAKRKAIEVDCDRKQATIMG
jgi:integrase